MRVKCASSIATLRLRREYSYSGNVSRFEDFQITNEFNNFRCAVSSNKFSNLQSTENDGEMCIVDCDIKITKRILRYGWHKAYCNYLRKREPTVFTVRRFLARSYDACSKGDFLVEGGLVSCVLPQLKPKDDNVKAMLEAIEWVFDQ